VVETKNIEKLKECDEMLEIKPNDAGWLSKNGHLLYISGKYEDALENCKKAVMEEPLDALAWVIIGSILSTKPSEIEESIRAYGNAKHICTEIDQNYNQVEMYDMALEVNPNDAVALFFKSRVYGSWGTSAEKEECYNKAIDLFEGFGVSDDVVVDLKMSNIQF